MVTSENYFVYNDCVTRVKSNINSGNGVQTPEPLSDQVVISSLKNRPGEPADEQDDAADGGVNRPFVGSSVQCSKNFIEIIWL